MPDNPRQNVTFASNGREAHGYQALPPSGTGPGLIIIQEWWGLVDHIADLTDRFAAEGFVALAPDLYGGRTTHDDEEANRMMEELPAEQAARDLSGAVDFLLEHEAVISETVGVVGFCMGGGFVLTLAARESARVSAAVPFYGIPGPETDFSELRAHVQGHFGEDDTSVPREGVEEIMARIEHESGINPEVYWYPAGHAFMNDQRESHDPASADRAWKRAVGFLTTQIR